jgi:hypothetical protein
MLNGSPNYCNTVLNLLEVIAGAFAAGHAMPRADSAAVDDPNMHARRHSHRLAEAHNSRLLLRRKAVQAIVSIIAYTFNVQHKPM